MSARFGRNKRRRMRAELAAKEAERVSLVAQLVERAKRNHDLVSLIEDWDGRVRAILGPDTALAIRANTVQERMYRPGHVHPLVDLYYGPPQELGLVMSYLMHTVEAMVEKDPAVFSGCLRVKVELPSGDYTYSVSERVLHEVGIDREIEESLARQIARQIARGVNERLGVKR